MPTLSRKLARLLSWYAPPRRFVITSANTAPSRLDVGAIPVRVRPLPLPLRLTVDEREAHVAFVATLGDSAIWREYLPVRDLARSA